MSYEYDIYLEQHKANVIKGFNFLRENFPDLTYFDNVVHQVYFGHDASKSDSEEYRAYDDPSPPGGVTTGTPRF